MERRWTLGDNTVFPLDESAIDLSSPGHILVPSQQEICLNPTYLKTDMFGTHPASGTHKSCPIRDVGLGRKTPALQEELKKQQHLGWFCCAAHFLQTSQTGSWKKSAHTTRCDSLCAQHKPPITDHVRGASTFLCSMIN